MKLKNIAADTGLTFLYLFSSCLITMLIESLLSFLLDRIAVIPYLVLTIIRLAVYSIGVSALLAAVGVFKGFHSAEFHPVETLLSGIPAVLLHLIFAIFFRFQAFVAGGARFAAGLIRFGRDITAKSFEQMPFSLFVGVFLAYGAFYIVVLLISEYIGAQKRQIQRARLH